MKKIILYNIIVLFLAVISFNSCTNDFDEINTNENQPTADQAAPDMLLTNALESMTDRVHEIFLGHEMGSCWVQHLAKVQYTDEDRYIPRVAVINNTWNSFYGASGYDVATIINVSEKNGELYDNYRGVGLVLQAYIVSVVSDLFGDVPFSQAWKGASEEAIIAPAYDTQEAIYIALNEQLELANSLLDEDGNDVNGDILYDGDILKWKKFANSLRLRLLLRMSGVSAQQATVTADMTAIVNDPTTYPIFESNEDNAALQYLGSAPNNHPINENRKTRDDHRVSKSLIDIQWANASYVDWRVVFYAELNAAYDYVGLPNGMLSSDAANYLGNGLANTSKIGTYFTKADAVGMLMSYAELQFILAEAAVKGFIPGGLADAEDYYINGIWGSYNQYANVENLAGRTITEEAAYWFGTPDDWTADDLAQDFYDNDDYAWDPANALELIGIQKWVAMFDQGLQAWFEWRRTGYPALTPAVNGMNGGTIPVRVYYPSDEYSRNPSNVATAVSRIGTDDMKTRVWWDID